MCSCSLGSITRRFLQDGLKGITEGGSTNRAVVTAGHATAHVTACTADEEEDIVTTPEPTRDGSCPRGTGIQGEKPEKGRGRKRKRLSLPLLPFALQ